MSAAEHEDEKGETLPAPYKVGYARPPVEHRFRRGQSGNPRGRPRGARSKPKVDTGLGMRAAEAYLREEAYQWLALLPGFAGKEKELRREFERHLERKVERDLL